MKLLIPTITSLVFFISCNFNKSAINKSDINNKDKRNENWIWWVDATTKKGEWIPVSDNPTWQNGRYTRFYNSGIIYETGRIESGVNVDTMFWYDPKGKLFGYGFENDDSKDYYLNDGPIKIFHQNGTLSQEGIIKNHTYGEQWKGYYSNGKIEYIQYYVNDSGWQVRYHENGQMKDSCYHMGTNTQTINAWYPNGKKRVSGNILNGVRFGPHLKFYENGQIMDSVYIVQGKHQGLGKHWYENGQLERQGIENDGTLEGDWIYYNESGKIKKILTYKNGEQIDLKKFD